MFMDDISDLQFIKNELLLREMNPWDKAILVYLAYIGYQNFQLANHSYQQVIKLKEDNFMEQFMLYFLLTYSLNNIHLSYKYFLFKTYTINKEVAHRVYNKFNRYFDYFSQSTVVPPVNEYHSQEYNYEEEEEVDYDELTKVFRKQENISHEEIVEEEECGTKE